MPIVHSCQAPGCVVLTMGDYCIDHEQAFVAAEAPRAPEGWEAALLADVLPDSAGRVDRVSLGAGG